MLRVPGRPSLADFDLLGQKLQEESLYDFDELIADMIAWTSMWLPGTVMRTCSARVHKCRTFQGRFAWQLSGALGFTGLLSSSAGGTVWALVLGVPTPIALEARLLNVRPNAVIRLYQFESAYSRRGQIDCKFEPDRTLSKLMDNVSIFGVPDTKYPSENILNQMNRL